MSEAVIDTVQLRASLLVSASEAAHLARCHEDTWWRVAKKSPVLRAAKRRRHNRTYWLTKVVVKWVEEGAS